MRSVKVLEMLNNGKIDELKVSLRDEIYEESLKKNPDSKKRYTAMKKYFSYTNNYREVCNKPCKIEFEDKEYTSFTNSLSLVLTTEDTGEIGLFNTENDTYPEVGRLIHLNGEKTEIDFNKILAEAKSKGYKLNKKEVGAGFEYLMRFNETYYKIGLIDISYGLINDGQPVTVYYQIDKRMPITIQNDIGIEVIMPIRIEDDRELDQNKIIEVAL